MAITCHAIPQAHSCFFSKRAVKRAMDLSTLRWTVDTWEDYEQVSRIFDCFPDNRFTWSDVLALTADRDWTCVNANVTQTIVSP